ncbi:MAG: hypothetical protein ABW049_07650, partial [Spongiibacteraceae bacterium]
MAVTTPDNIDNAVSAIDTIQIESVDHAELSAADRAALKARIKDLLKREDAVMVAHYYTDPLL